tara:strand:+ start:219 stop:419 length:201 start_codon:yes stop_codon:yes gene_type:complete
MNFTPCVIPVLRLLAALFCFRTLWQRLLLLLWRDLLVLLLLLAIVLRNAPVTNLMSCFSPVLTSTH